MKITTANAQHKYPVSIAEEAKVALSYYPELDTIPITFKFKKKIKKSTMQAQPTFGSFFKSRKNRSYVILMSERFKISDTVYKTVDMPKNIMIGWLGHELGHVMDYQNRTKSNLIGFGLQYLFSEKYIKEAERCADTFAVAHGMEKYILETKNFILNNAKLSEKYKSRIKKYYLSPEEIMQLVEERDAAVK
ncbi:hypothetical protein FGM00_05525 [Aggregatimonas sangjinii]|uniref:Uncharacterized protein n=1 Tax=Aggregatimonas sangjinii TaxID=2583587 RepID=A0A5B7SRG6_9FLAO|nr:hypothetical protein [Aggregatimonas sangjinii]QCW99587.1 hypothetical protein FGM00_05525 [Aggregatimonas sangjinii]